MRHIRGLADAAQMPKGSPALNAEELHLIRQWIAAGALDDSMAAAKTLSAPNSSQHTALNAGRLLDRLVYDALSPQERFVQTRRYRVSFLPDQTSPPGPGNPIDAFISAKWREAQLPEAEVPPALCDDSTFARRVYLDLTGLIPPLQEAQAFVADPTPDKRTLLIERLLSRTNDYAAHWTPFWEDALGSSPQTSTAASDPEATIDSGSSIASRPISPSICSSLSSSTPRCPATGSPKNIRPTDGMS